MLVSFRLTLTFIKSAAWQLEGQNILPQAVAALRHTSKLPGVIGVYKLCLQKNKMRSCSGANMLTPNFPLGSHARCFESTKWSKANDHHVSVSHAHHVDLQYDHCDNLM